MHSMTGASCLLQDLQTRVPVRSENSEFVRTTWIEHTVSAPKGRTIQCARRASWHIGRFQRARV